MGPTFRFLVSINLLFSVCSGGDVISAAKETSKSISSISKDFNHLGSRDSIHATNAQTNRDSSDHYGKSFEKFPFRATVERNVKPFLVRMTATASPFLFNIFLTSNDPMADRKPVTEATMTQNDIRLPTSPKIRVKRCGKVNEKLAEFTSYLKAAKQIRAQYGKFPKINTYSIRNDKSTETAFEETPPLIHAAAANTTKNVTSSSNAQFSTTEPTGFPFTYNTTFTSTKTANLSTTDVSSSIPTLDNFTTKHNLTNTESTSVTSPGGGPKERSSDETTTGFMGTSDKDLSMSTDSAANDSTTTGKSVKATEVSEKSVADSTSDETDKTKPFPSTATDTAVTESSTESETDDPGTTEIMTTSTLTSSSLTDDVTESSSVTETNTSTMETVTTTTSSSLTEIDVTESSTVSEPSSMETITTLASSSLSTDTDVTTEESSTERETTSTIKTTTYPNIVSSEIIRTADLLSTENIVTLLTNATKVVTENFSDSSSEETAVSSLKTSTVSPGVMTKDTTSMKHSDITSVVHSTETEPRLSTEDRSSTVDEFTDHGGQKKAALSAGKIAWIVIGILIVFAAFTGGIFFGNRYRTLYQKREDTIALVVRNHNHRLYY